ncbi:MAG TPA: hypothetical protein VF469_16030, partial [Kofleriaceae bacterium]
MRRTVSPVQRVTSACMVPVCPASRSGWMSRGSAVGRSAVGPRFDRPGPPVSLAVAVGLAVAVVVGPAPEGRRQLIS